MQLAVPKARSLGFVAIWHPSFIGRYLNVWKMYRDTRPMASLSNFDTIQHKLIIPLGKISESPAI